MGCFMDIKVSSDINIKNEDVFITTVTSWISLNYHLWLRKFLPPTENVQVFDRLLKIME